MSKRDTAQTVMNWIAGAAGLYFAGITLAGAIKRKREGIKGIGAFPREDDDFLPTVMQYSQLLDMAHNKLGISKEEARKRYGLYTIGQWKNLLGIGAIDWGAYAEYVNKPKDGRRPYVVKLWSGSGYLLDLFVAYADDDEQALERVVAYLEKTKQTRFFIDDATEEDEDMGIALYIDATMEGAKRPHYIYLENLAILPVPEDRLPYDWKKRGKYGEF